MVAERHGGREPWWLRRSLSGSRFPVAYSHSALCIPIYHSGLVFGIAEREYATGKRESESDLLGHLNTEASSLDNNSSPTLSWCLSIHQDFNVCLCVCVSVCL